ncbi:hypothetical protein NESM_000872700 [Novymonas esmeraldas]|uniref:Uncharacterized protein n=1 Tax=Novymonas esmeraldas TaxID=1808958 RepID=A0AAW0EXG4_9TRYP
MEVVVEQQHVLLTTHKTYSEVGELHSLRAFAQYPPLRAYLTKCAASGPMPSAVVVRRLERVAHRITGAVVDLVYAAESGGGVGTTQALRLGNTDPAVLLPVLVVDGRRHAVLARQAQVSQGLAVVPSAIRGTVGASGEFVGAAHASALECVGLRIAEATPLSPASFTIGSEGEPAVRLFTVVASCDAEGVQRLQQQSSDLTLVALEDVFAAGDAAASLAVSLLWSAA